MAESWKPIQLSAKVFGHLSQGLYRTPAGAIKELISNSFDADATRVRIHTGFPRFETFSCEDNGTGMSVEEFERLMNRGIGNSYKRTSSERITEGHQRPLIGRLGLGILSLAQICTRFDIESHHKKTKTAFRATIQFPAYTRQEMDKIAKKIEQSNDEEQIHGGTYQLKNIIYDTDKRGVRVFTTYLREAFRKRMRALQHLANKKSLQANGPYKTFTKYLDAIYNPAKTTASLNLLSDYDQLLFGLALAPPLPLVPDRNVAVLLPMIQTRQAKLKQYAFEVEVDNLSLANPVCLPSDREGNDAKQCRLSGSETKSFELHDGAVKESCDVIRHDIAVARSDLQFHLYEINYARDNVAGHPLEFKGYLFQQTGRLYPRDIQGVLIRIGDVAIGKYDNSMLTYPYAEGPRYSMVSSELFVHRGFEDALNIDRDSFNELHPHYMRVQAYVHGLLQGLVFPGTWSEEKERNKARRELAAKKRDATFVESYRKATGDSRIRSIQRVEKRAKTEEPPKPNKSPVEFEGRRGEIEIDRTHPLLQAVFRRKKYASLIDRLIVAFERSNQEPTASRRRELFYKLLEEIFLDL